MALLDASLDTSFWNIAAQIGVIPYLFSFFSEQAAATEASLMKQWIREGMRAKRIGLAIQAYLERKADLRGAAAMAGVSYNRFLREVQARNIVILEDNVFLDRLGFLADTFEDEDLRSAIRKVIRAEAETP